MISRHPKFRNSSKSSSVGSNEPARLTSRYNTPTHPHPARKNSTIHEVSISTTTTFPYFRALSASLYYTHLSADHPCRRCSASRGCTWPSWTSYSIKSLAVDRRTDAKCQAVYVRKRCVCMCVCVCRCVVSGV